MTFPLHRYSDSSTLTGAISVREDTGYPYIDKILVSYGDVFSDTNLILGYCDLQTCRVDTGDSLPIYQWAYRAPLVKRKIIDKQIDEML